MFKINLFDDELKKWKTIEDQNTQSYKRHRDKQRDYSDNRAKYHGWGGARFEGSMNDTQINQRRDEQDRLAQQAGTNATNARKQYADLEKKNKKANEISSSLYDKVIGKKAPDKLKGKEKEILDQIKQRTTEAIDEKHPDLDPTIKRLKTFKDSESFDDINSFDPIYDAFQDYESSRPEDRNHYPNFDRYAHHHQRLMQQKGEGLPLISKEKPIPEELADQATERNLSEAAHNKKSNIVVDPLKSSLRSQSIEQPSVAPYENKNPGLKSILTQEKPGTLVDALRKEIAKVNPASPLSLSMEQQEKHGPITFNPITNRHELAYETHPELASLNESYDKARTATERNRVLKNALAGGTPVDLIKKGKNTRFADSTLPTKEGYRSIDKKKAPEKYRGAEALSPEEETLKFNEGVKRREEQNKKIAELNKTDIAKGIADENIQELDEMTAQYGPKWLQQGQKGAAELLARELDSPYIPYPNRVTADLSRNQQTYRDMLSQMNPDDPDYKKKREAIDALLNTYTQDNEARDVIDPYLEEMKKNPGQYQHELFGDAEEDYINTIKEQSRRELEEDILPMIRSKFMTPGTRHSGGMNAEIAKVTEKYNRGTKEALSKIRSDFRSQSIQAGLQHQGQQGEAAGIASKAAIQNRQNQLEAQQAREAHNQNNISAKRTHASDVNNIGAQDQAIQQQKNNEDNAQWNAAEAHRQGNIKNFTDNMNKHPASRAQGFVGPNLAIPVDTAKANLLTGAGAMASGMGSNMLPRNSPYKKGGKVKKAIGGSVNPIMSEAVTNAMVDKTDPVSALRHLMNHNMGMEALQQSKQRQKYNTGGMVSPIQKGASEAKQFVDHTSMNRMHERLRQPDRTPRFVSALDAGMKAMANADAGFMSTVGKAHTGAAEDVRARNDAYTGRLNEADKSEYALAKAEYDRKVAERKSILNEDILGETKRHHMAQEGHWANKTAAKTAALKQKMIEKAAIQTPADIKRQNEALRVLNAIGDVNDTTEETYGHFKDLNTSKAKQEFVETGFLPKSWKRNVVSGYDSVFGDNNKIVEENGVKTIIPRKHMDVRALENAEAAAERAYQANLELVKAENPAFSTRQAEQATLAKAKQNAGNTPEANAAIFTHQRKKAPEKIIRSIRALKASKTDPAVIQEQMDKYGITWDQVNGTHSGETLPDNPKNRSTDYKTVQENPDGTSTVKDYKPLGMSPEEVTLELIKRGKGNLLK